MILHILLPFVIFCWIISIVRIMLSSIASDWLIIQQLRQRKAKVSNYLPMMSILIPAYNEELTITRTLESVVANRYPRSKAEIIVINDGSIDKTKDVVQTFRREHCDGFKIRLINRPNRGKARSLNYALRRCAKGSIVMCLDADTSLNDMALRNTVRYFRNRNTVALSCYPDIIEDGSIMSLAQRIEYIIGYRVKSAQTQLGVNYIISGTGSAFRRSILKRVKYYESNTMTEDLDLTMKILANKRKRERIDYARDVVACTEAVHTVDALLKQRFRWTYGRAQVFVKYSRLFFSRNEQHEKRLTWGMLPFALIQDLSFLLSPLVNGFFVYYFIQLGNTALVRGGVVTMAVYLWLCIWSVEHLSVREKLRLSYYAPPMYILIYLTVIAEYYSLLKAILLAPTLKASLKRRHVTWSSPARAGA